MATLTINFQANTTGDHYVGYREIHMDPPNTYTVLTVNVTTPGATSVDIDIPGSLYCGELHYAGYIIAACQSQTDANADGIPDAAITWSNTLLQQTDPCTETEITCDNTGIDTISIDVAGTGYSIGNVIAVVEANVGDEVVPATVTVGNIGALGEITAVSIDFAGSYKEAPNLDATGVGNGDAVLSVTAMEDCPEVDLTTIDCAGVESFTGKSGWIGELGEVLTICTDSSTLAGLGSQFTAALAGNCKCRGCESVTLDASAATSGGVIVTYNRCWDRGAGEVLVVRQVNAGETLTDIDCIIPETLTLQVDSLDVPLNVTYGNCPPNS